MSMHENAQALLAWIRERPEATISDIVESGLLKSRSTVSHAARYAEKSGALERIVRSGASARDRVRFRATGIALPEIAPEAQDTGPSFDGLLQAWGIAHRPVTLPMLEARRHQLSDDG
ncbi:hypothetical protein M3A49_41485 [Paraburkholderia sp. CNPSo 3076]|uniref:hypothetical protein n=1 Tax=Paraburkholderia sp. CNPSo 3076 TaxID=2940936 RepID=UPI00225959F5|nr:hypothetical protein [Paraburkholderia sp. CNPSo 3076]MCX5545799.1 hypothetical protein [Paraburkholderia sp. CNPSo 3076]